MKSFIIITPPTSLYYIFVSKDGGKRDEGSIAEEEQVFLVENVLILVMFVWSTGMTINRTEECRSDSGPVNIW